MFVLVLIGCLILCGLEWVCDMIEGYRFRKQGGMKSLYPRLWK